MKTIRSIRALTYVLLLTSHFLLPTSSSAQAPLLINYQGRVVDGTNLVNGTISLRFRLFSGPVGGSILYEGTNVATAVDGLYQTTIGEFNTLGTLSAGLGVTSGDGSPRWLEIAVNGTTLTPRERLNAVPFSIATYGLWPRPNNGFTLGVFSQGLSTGPQGENAVVLGGQQNQALSTNSAVVAGRGNQIDTWSHGSIVLGGYGNEISYSAPYNAIVGGYSNSISSGTRASIISGGELNVVVPGVRHASIGGGALNRAEGHAATVAGGSNNVAGGMYATVPGGLRNTASADYAFAAGRRAGSIHPGAFVWGDSTDADVQSSAADQVTFRASGGFRVLGGAIEGDASGLYNFPFVPLENTATNVGALALMEGNVASAFYATVSGGRTNTASGPSSTVAGGSQNNATATFAAIGGGHGNLAEGIGSTVGGGGDNSANLLYATAAGGRDNVAFAGYSTVGGGEKNRATSSHATVAGGFSNTASAAGAMVGGGSVNVASGGGSVVGGGLTNRASGLGSTVAGGIQNVATGLYTTVGGGLFNSALGRSAHVGGGEGNWAVGSGASVAGGEENNAATNWATVAGGFGNDALGMASFVGGGSGNQASGLHSTVAGGWLNQALGLYATIPGGANNSATNYAFAAGRRAKAIHAGSFVWADNTDADFASTATNQFLIRANRGVGINTNNPQATLHVAGEAMIGNNPQPAKFGMQRINSGVSGALFTHPEVNVVMSWTTGSRTLSVSNGTPDFVQVSIALMRPGSTDVEFTVVDLPDNTVAQLANPAPQAATWTVQCGSDTRPEGFTFQGAGFDNMINGLVTYWE